MQQKCISCLKQFAFFFSLSFLSCITGAIINLQKNTSVPALIVFGDSVVDTGNNDYIKTLAKVNYPPYGQDFMGGKPTGRFSNGKVPSDLIAEELGIKPFLPPYLDPSLQARDLLTGVNFASGGAGYDPLTSHIALALSMLDQLELFREYIAKLKNIAGEERSLRILSESLFVIFAGSNDMTNTYFGIPALRQFKYDISSYTTLLVSYASKFVQDLYRLGARKIGVVDLAPIGCLPSQRTMKGGSERKCVDEYNKAAQLYNKKLSDELNSINKRYPEATIIYMDIYEIVLDMIYNPHKYGFEISNKGCCGTGTIEVLYLCRHACSNVSEYVFWDSFHPTEKAYKILVHKIIKQNLNRFII